MLDRPPTKRRPAAPSAAADKRRAQYRARRRRWRQRKAAGKVLLSVEAEEIAFTEALVLSRRLSADVEPTRNALAQAASVVIDDFVARWVSEKPK
jgi:hypothetical protein